VPYGAGRTREALAALETALQLDPDNYPAALRLAELFQAGNPTVADDIYSRLLLRHPEFRGEISRIWFRSLLGRGQLAGVAGLARQQLVAEPAQAAVWVNALVFSAQHLRRSDLLDVAADKAVPAASRAVLLLASRVAQAPTPAARRALLVQTPLIDDFPYDRVYRIGQLLTEGFPRDALSLLGASADQLGGRDIARFTLAAYAMMGDTLRLNREFDALLAPGRRVSGAELSLLALHLVRYPDPTLLTKVMAATDRIGSEPGNARLEAYLNVFCAAGVQANQPAMRLMEKRLAATASVSVTAFSQFEVFFPGLASGGKYNAPLPALNPFSLECTYAVLDRYLRQ